MKYFCILIRRERDQKTMNISSPCIFQNIFSRYYLDMIIHAFCHNRALHSNQNHSLFILPIHAILKILPSNTFHKYILKSNYSSHQKILLKSFPKFKHNNVILEIYSFLSHLDRKNKFVSRRSLLCKVWRKWMCWMCIFFQKEWKVCHSIQTYW